MPYTAFISHSVSPHDYGLVTTIANLLWQRGIQAFVPEVYPPAKLTEQIALQIETSDAVLVLVTRETVRSAWVNQEVGFALAKGRWVLPLVERGVNPEGFLHDLKWVEFDRLDFTPVFGRVADYLRHQADEKKAQESFVAGVAGAAILGLGLWLWNQGGKESK
jgi:nucleoside 2-deoxyribosyltransferase